MLAFAGNTAPTLATASSITVTAGASTTPLAVVPGDAETAAGALTVQVFSTDEARLPDSALVPGGSGVSRSLTLSPVSGQTGAATITLSLSDGSYTRSAWWLLTVTDAAAAAAQFSRPRGVFILDSGGPLNYTTTFGSTISLRDANLRPLPFVDGFTLRVAWSDVESGTTPGHYDFFIIQNLLKRA